MSFYADTSFLFSYYASDTNSSRADSWRQLNSQSLPFGPLHRLELRNAFELAAFQGRISAAEANNLWAEIESDFNAGLLISSNIDLADLFHRAHSLAQQHTAQTGSRSLDILHVAAAQMLAAGELVTFDVRQATLANRVGLQVAVL